MKTHTALPALILCGLMSAVVFAQTPVPFLSQPLVPDAMAPGGPDFTLTVNGAGFVSNSVVNWNGSALATQFVSSSQLTATVPAANIATVATAWVTVANPAPGGTSNTVFFTVTANAGDSVFFAPGPSVNSGTGPFCVVVGDFNGDGKVDLAFVVPGKGKAHIALGDGTGNFTLVSPASTGNNPVSIAVGDFNNDGRLDLVSSNYNNNNLSVFAGDGAGNLTRVSHNFPSTGSQPLSVAAGDFNGDGKLDLAVANFGSNSVSVLLGDGAGNFSLASSPATGAFPVSLAVGDFNGDGKLDLAVANQCGSDDLCITSQGTVSILLGDGAGNFSLTSSPATGNDPSSVVVADFNGDGKPDLAVANLQDSTVSILLGDGSGNFTLASSPETGAYPISLAVGDLNGDGKPDLAVANEAGDSVSILLGDGAGNFTLALSPPAGHYPTSLALGDFDGDGKLDVAVADNGHNTISILRAVPFQVALSPSSLTFAIQLVGSTSPAQTIILTNSGGTPLTVTSITASANFKAVGLGRNCSSTPADASCKIAVTFTPSTIGTFTGSVTFVDSASNSPQVVPLTGVGTVVALSPSKLTFATQLVGTTSPPQTVTLTNTSTHNLSIGELHFTGSNPGAFAQTNTCGTRVPAGRSCTISVTFSPHKLLNTAALSVVDNGGGSPQTVSLTGTGTFVGVTPTNLNFGFQPVGVTSHPQVTTLANAGSTSLAITSINITGASNDFSQNNNCAGGLAAGGTCTISVFFTPRSQGQRTATINIVDDGGGSPQTVALSGTGT